MTALYVIGGVILLLLVILFIPVGIYVRWDGEIALSLVVGLVKVRLMPKKEKEIDLRDFSKRNFEKMLRREEKKKAKAEAKAKKKKPAQSAPSSGEKKDEGKGSGLVKALWELRDTITDIVVKFTHRIRTEAVKVDVAVGAQDAASCAILYGAVSQFCAYVLEFLSANTKMSGGEDINVRADFGSEKTVCDIAFVFRSRVVHALAAAVRFGISYLTRPKHG